MPPDVRAVFLDRDGTLIIDTGYPKNPDEVELIPEAVDALRRLRQAGYRLVVVSNQSGIGRGLVTHEQVWAVHERFVSRLAEQGLFLDGAYYCPHSPDADCICRKPSPGMLQLAAQELSLDLTQSFMIGDKPSDVEAGRRAGCDGFLLSGPGDWGGVLTTILERA